MISFCRRLLYALPNFCEKRVRELSDAIGNKYSEKRLRAALRLALLAEILIVLFYAIRINGFVGQTPSGEDVTLLEAAISCTIMGDILQVFKSVDAAMMGGTATFGWYATGLIAAGNSYFWLLSGPHYLGFILLSRLLKKANFRIPIRIVYYIVYTLFFSIFGRMLENWLFINAVEAWKALRFPSLSSNVTAFSARFILFAAFALALLSMKLLIFACKEMCYFLITLLGLAVLGQPLLHGLIAVIAIVFTLPVMLLESMGILDSISAAFSEAEWAVLLAALIYFMLKCAFLYVYKKSRPISSASSNPPNKSGSNSLTVAKYIFLYPEVAILLGLCLYYSFNFLFMTERGYIVW